jgi:hypothetical protein
MTDIPRKPFGGTMDGYRCELCGAWVEYRNLSKVLAHEGPLPHVEQDRLAGENGNDCDCKRVRLNQSVPPVSNQRDEDRNEQRTQRRIRW